MDKRIWILDSPGRFSSKSFYNVLSNPLNVDTSFPHHLAWKPTAPPMVKVVSWTTIIGRINTLDILQKRRPFMHLSPQWCPLCKRDGESVHHIFMHCSFTYEVCIYFISRMRINWVMPEKLSQLFCSWWSYGSNVRSKQFGECLLRAIL